MRRIIYLLLLSLAFACEKDNEITVPNGPDTEGYSFIINGIDNSVSHAILSLQNADTIIRDSLTYNQINQQLTSTLRYRPLGEFELTISIFEGKNILEGQVPNKEAKTFLYQGIESLSSINIGENDTKLIIQGPITTTMDPDLLPSWSSRLFHVYQDPSLANLTMSFPKNPCEFDIRFIPNYLIIQPEYSYIDYFIWNEDEGYTAIDFSECLSECDVHRHIRSFGDKLIDDEDVSLCKNTSWQMADTFISLLFGQEAGDLVIFYQRWDENGKVIIPDVGTSPRGRRNHRIKELMK